MKLRIAKIFTFILTPLRWTMLLHFKLLAKLVNKYGKNNLPWWVKYLVLDFIWLDVKGNWIISGMFMDWPRHADETITYRLQRYITTLPKRKNALTSIQLYRLNWASRICKKLNKYDPGHCWKEK